MAMSEADKLRGMIQQEQLPEPGWKLNWQGTPISQGTAMASNTQGEPQAPEVNTGPAIDISKFIAPDMSQYIQAVQAAGGPAAKMQMQSQAQAGIAKALSAASAQSALAEAQSVQATKQSAEAADRMYQEQDRISAEQQLLIQDTANQIIPISDFIARKKQVDQMDTQLNQQEAELAKRRANGITDNPFNWLYDQFALPVDVAAHNMQVNVRNNINRQADNMLAATTDAAAQIKATSANTSAELLKATHEHNIAQSAKIVAVASMEQAKNSLPFLKMAQETAGQSFGEQMAAINAKIAQSNLDFKWSVEAPSIKLQMQLNQDVLNNKIAYDQTIKTAAAKFGVDINPIALDRMSQGQREAILTIGVAASSAERVYTPSQMVDAYKAAGMPPKNESTGRLLAAMYADREAITQQVVALAKGGNLGLQTPEAVRARIDSDFNQRWAHAAQSTNTDSMDGYKAPSYGALAASGQFNQALQGIPLWRDVFGKYADNPQTKQLAPTVKSMVAAANDLVLKGQITPMAAAEQLVAINKQITTFNSYTNDFTALGLPMQDTMRAPVPEFIGKSFSGGIKTADLNDKAWLANYFMKQQASGLADRLLSSVGATAGSLTKLPENALNSFGTEVLNRPKMFGNTEGNK